MSDRPGIYRNGKLIGHVVSFTGPARVGKVTMGLSRKPIAIKGSFTCKTELTGDWSGLFDDREERIAAAQWLLIDPLQ